MSNLENSYLDKRSITVTVEELMDITKFKEEYNITLECVMDGMSYPAEDNSNHLRKLAAKIFKSILLENNDGELFGKVNYGNIAVTGAMGIIGKYMSRILHYLVSKVEDADMVMEYRIDKADDNKYTISYVVKKVVL